MTSQGPNAGQPDHERHGLLESAVDTFVDSTRAVLGRVTAVGSSALGAVPEPVPSAVTHMLVSLRHLIDQAPRLTAELDVLVDEVHAKRLSIRALSAELEALDHQLALLEQSLAPLEVWNRQWDRVQRALVQTIDQTLDRTPRDDD
ncbi:hypothetical protein [Nocardioides mesophilus]|uniref:Uncharacterized protein n=1 Tax=Nocardioides mesophilus TaxID=433659 RepID=A0A7G9RAQ9_9ACTN|nr:hypothetical protein [Nocardioides mesophilus]QNN52684.1 hypothetical protein H9L09_19950 [Nocardioides mesophilus]